MKALSKILMGATALTMVAGMAYAGDYNVVVVDQNDASNHATITQDGGTDDYYNQNRAKITQDGVENSANITQDGQGNQAGRHLLNGANDPTESASAYNYILQSGDNNSLTVRQDQKGNTIGIGTGQNLIQTGDHNAADITQHGGASSGGTVGDVRQTASGSATSLTNQLTITQSGAAGGAYDASNPSEPSGSSDYHYAKATINNVHQTNMSGGAANDMTLTQSGGIANDGNLIDYASQNGDGNTMTVSQDGRSHVVTDVSQVGSGNTADVSQTNYANTLTLLSQDGTDNMAMVTQDGVDNDASINVQGDYNTSNVNQDSGSVDGYAEISISGSSSNVVSVDQTGGNSGTSNTGTVTITNGADGNNVGVTQDGNNMAEIAIDAGDDNVVAVNQTGYNDATININPGSGNYTHGDHNMLNVMQNDGSAGRNSMNVTITGSYNNNPASGHAPLFDGDAAAARDTGVSLTSLDHLYKGDLYQDGSTNTVTLTVDSNDNAFATLQSGSNNTINGTISGGAGMNQAVVVQVNSNNSATFTQNGFGNNLGIVQGGVSFP